MFIQICLATAGLHYGSKLWKRWKESPAEAARPEQPSAEVPPILPGATPALPPDAAVVAEPAANSLTAALPAEEVVDRQFKEAIAATSLTIIAHFFAPQLRFFGAVSVMYGSIFIFRRGKELLLEERRVGIEVLDSIGMIASIAARQYGVSAAMFMIYTAAQKLRIATEKASREGLADIFGQKPENTWVLRDGVEVSVPVQSLVPGDIVVVTAGAAIPADGVVVEGMALVDQHALTGEAQPAEKAHGAKVLAMTVVVTGSLHIRVETAGKDTAAAEIAEILSHTADFSSSVELESRRIADASALPILGLGVVAAATVGVHGAVAMLNIGIADNLRLATPLSMLNHLRSAYAEAILLKDGRSLELLPKVDTIVFDKTGTLTEGELQVIAVHAAPCGDASEADVLICAAAAEHRQTHPIASAIQKEAEKRGYSIPAIHESGYEIGYGLTAKMNGQTVRVGSRRFMEAYALDVPASLCDLESAIYAAGRSLVYVARDDSVIGMIEMDPILRPEVDGVIKALKDRGLSIYLLSGDHEKPTQAMAHRLKLDGYFAGVLPQDKAHKIEEIMGQGRAVCYVGDGINDAIALKKATVSVSMSGASAVAADSAQVLLMEGGIGKLPELFRIADGFEQDTSKILMTALVPMGLSIAGVFIAGFTTNVVATLYVLSLASGVWVATGPNRKNLRLRAFLDKASVEALSA